MQIKETVTPLGADLEKQETWMHLDADLENQETNAS